MSLPEHLPTDDLVALRRAVQRMLGLGFRLLVVEAATPPQRKQLQRWLELQVREQDGALVSLDLSSLPGKNLWAELKDRLGTIPLKSLLFLWGMEATEYEHKRDGFGQMMNVQRDILVRDFPVIWVLVVHPALRAQLREVAPDFFDYALRWIRMENPAPEVANTAYVPSLPGSLPPLPLGELSHPERALLEESWAALGRWEHNKVRDGVARLRLRSLPRIWEPLLLLIEAHLSLREGGAETRSLFQRAIDQLADPTLQGVARVGLAQYLLQIGELAPAKIELEKVEEPEATDWWAEAEIFRARLDALGGAAGASEQRLQQVRSRLPPGTRAWADVGDALGDRLTARGEWQEALRIRREELLPVCEQLGDVRSRAVTMGKIADVLQARGEWPEALRIRREEVLPVFEQLGDIRERAVTMGKIASGLSARGELKEALRIRREEVLPVHKRLGGAVDLAVTQCNIAFLLSLRKEHDEAWRLLTKEVIPALEKLDSRSKVVEAQRMLGFVYANRNRKGDRLEAKRVLQRALREAEQLGMAREIEQINGILADLKK